MWAPPPTTPVPLTQERAKGYSSLACFSLQSKEDGRLSFSPGLEQGRIQFLYLPHFLAVHQKWVVDPSGGPQKQNWQSHLTA